MSVIDEIRTAEARLEGENPHEWLAEARGKTPRELSTRRDQANRREFLRDSLGDTARAEIAFERILGGNELQDVNYLARGARAAQAVARVAIRDGSGRLRGWGTGFLIAPGVLLTNNHVLGDEGGTRRSEVHFGFERDVDGHLLQPVTFSLAPDRLFLTDKALDFTVVAVEESAQNSTVALSTYGTLPLVGTLGKITEGEWLTIVQHPNGEQKQVCVRENRFLRKKDDVIWYSTDTVGGSSGSPVFNSDWYVVALHHSGVPEEKNGRIQTLDGRDFDPERDSDARIRWIANEGIRASRIVETLQGRLPGHQLLQPLFRVTPATARIPDLTSVARRAIHISPYPASRPASSQPPTEALPMSPVQTQQYPMHVSVGLRIETDGSVSVESANSRASEAAFLEAKTKKPAAFDVPFDADYSKRGGYESDFLGEGNRVNLPDMSAALTKEAARLIDPSDDNLHVLTYHNYSVVMHARRRFAIYSAANVTFGSRFDLSRPPDVWRVDPRILLAHQVTNFYYKGNQFDRGHLTRREDLEFGDTAKRALQSAADTCHWTNCVPQHSGFNQNKELWQGIERHLLEGAIMQGKLDAQVFTGPILEEDDPVYQPHPKIQYPVRFWKVVAVLDEDSKLFATAFILDQSDVIDQLGIDEAVPIAAYKTFQVQVKEVERLTGLTFTAGKEKRPLSDSDPLREGLARRAGRRSSRRLEESAGIDVPTGYALLRDLESIVTPGAA